MLADAVRRVIGASRSLAVFAIVVEAMDQRAAAFYRDFGFAPFSNRALRLFMPMIEAAEAVSRALGGRLSKRQRMPQSLYTIAMLGVYELNKIDLLKDLFIWAYERSAARYVAIRQSLGEPDPFRLRHRAALRKVIGEIVRGRMARTPAIAHVAA